MAKRGRPTKIQSILNNAKSVQCEPKTAIATGMFLPNQSGDHSKGSVRTTPTQDTNIPNKKYVDDQNTTQDTAIGLNTTHRGSNGTDHANVVLNDTHRGSNGTDHANVVLNDTHRADNSQAHTDYLVNNANDTTTGILTMRRAHIIEPEATGSPRINLYQAGSLRTFIQYIHGFGTVFDADGSIYLKPNNTTALSIRSDGKVGTGTITNPLCALHADGAIASSVTTITASTDTLDVSGLNTVFINPAAAVVIGGFVGGIAGQVLFVSAIANGQDITLEHVEGVGGDTQDIYLHSGIDETLSTEYGGWTLTCDGTNWYDTSHA